MSTCQPFLILSNKVHQEKYSAQTSATHLISPHVVTFIPAVYYGQKYYKVTQHSRSQNDLAFELSLWYLEDKWSKTHGNLEHPEELFNL